MILAMTGLESQLLKGATAGVAANIILLIALVPSLGAEGAAARLAISGLITNTMFAYLAWTRAGLYAPAIPFPRRNG